MTGLRCATRPSQISGRATGDYVEYTWDFRNRLMAVEFYNSSDVLQEVIEYDYDAASDLRIRRRHDPDGDTDWDSIERYIYDGGDVTIVMDETGGGSALDSWYLHGPGTDDVLARWEAGADTRWALADAQGSVRDVIVDNAPGTFTLVRHRNYSSFGAVNSDSSPATEFLYGYTGRLWDSDAELQYNRARWYDPAVGKFVSEDPLGFSAGDANLTRYVGNSSQNFTDPSGLQILTPDEDKLVPTFPGYPGPDFTGPGAPSADPNYPAGSAGAHQSGEMGFIEDGANDWIEEEFEPWFRKDFLDDILGINKASKPYRRPARQQSSNANPSTVPAPSDGRGVGGSAGANAGSQAAAHAAANPLPNGDAGVDAVAPGTGAGANAAANRPPDTGGGITVGAGKGDAAHFSLARFTAAHRAEKSCVPFCPPLSRRQFSEQGA